MAYDAATEVHSMASNDGNGLDLLGQQLVMALQFAESGFNTDLALEDSVTDAPVRAGEAFQKKERNRWFMRWDSLPGHVGIKAIAVDRDAIYLETAPFDTERIRELIAERMLPVSYDEKRRCFVDTSTGKPLITVTIADAKVRQATRNRELAPRCMWTLPLDVDPIRKRTMIALADLVYTDDAYRVEDVETQVPDAPVHSFAGAQRMTMQLQMELRQTLELEQRPLLSLTTEQRLEQRLEIQQVLALEQRIGHMSFEELLEYANSDPSPEGQHRVLKVFVFVLAGRVKRALAATQPNMTWREARRVARTLVAHPGSRRRPPRRTN